MTVREIAAAIGVSPATVSFVLNNKPGVRKEVRDRVTVMLLENGYQIRDKQDGVFKVKNTGNIKLIRYKGANHQAERYEDFVLEILDGVESAAREKGYSLSVTNVTDHDLQGIPDLASSEHVDGILFLASEFDRERFQEVLAFPVPTVSIDNYFQNHPVPCVNTNNIDGTYAAIEYLYKLGHREIGYLKSSFAIGGILPRSVGTREAMAHFGLELDAKYVFEFDMLFDSVYDQMCSYLERGPQLPTAFIADSDIIAAACQKALQKYGIVIPDDLSIIGFDDLSISSMVTPPLTTMRVPRNKIGQIAVERLIYYMTTKDPVATKVSVSTELIVRGTTAPPKTGGPNCRDDIKSLSGQ